MEEILGLFPENIRQTIYKTLKGRWGTLQEIRFRIQQPIELIFDDHTEWLDGKRPDKNDSIFVLNQLSEFSLYKMEDELREGYVTIEGGHRIGLSGKVNTVHGHVKAIQHITFFNIRIASEKIGAALPFMPYIYKNQYLSTLLIGPPQTGKTTLIRDIARLIGSGWNRTKAHKVGIIDERSEIGGSKKGLPQHDLGKRTDVMDACPKDEGMMMMIRSMSPEVLIVDEIGTESDVQALMEAINAGVIVICSIHGDSLESLMKRPSLQPLFHQQIFQRFVLLNGQAKPGQMHHIYNQTFENINQKPRCVTNAVDWRASFHRDHNAGRV
ncbi:stage III sporulation protein AA [Lentibacillus amyloliquefaciens]|uniref:Stage III sporulation protein AA n=1 Tax=Lentibacillus amyloliquefaciens TaxID=1472767 RepID=A0A0U4F3A4_9BACI|nr:stage III sporulation protein AA [Lentibacillus amyloliquefaciens]ALX48054.1 stage III sporulation protein AA [Lentibacillus amyloliquefaciens]